MIKSVCVYCSSSSAVPQAYFDIAKELGQALCKHNLSLVFGGVDVGLMGTVAETVKEYKGRVVGVVPQSLVDKGYGSKLSDEVIVAKDLRERKAIMEESSDAFISLPGGFGTLEELLEVLTLKQLHLHNKAIVLINIDGAFDGLLQQFEHGYDNSLIKREFGDLYCVAQTVSEALSYIVNYSPKPIPDKWY